MFLIKKKVILLSFCTALRIRLFDLLRSTTKVNAVTLFEGRQPSIGCTKCIWIEVWVGMTKRRKICPTELDMSDKNDKKTQDMSDRARYVRQK